MTTSMSVVPARQPKRRLLMKALWKRGLGDGALLASAIALTACSTTAARPPIASAPSLLPIPPPQETVYRVQVGDDLAVRFLTTPELNEEVVVRPDGKISTTIAEEVPAAGRTIPQITADLRRRYKSELMTPRLNVIVKSFAPMRIYVSGEVPIPGEYTTVGPGLTLSQAIARAGGTRVSASTSRVFIIRRGPGDRPMVFATRYNDVITGRDASADVRLAPYDVVYVPRSGITQAYLYWNQFFQQFVPVSWGFSYILNNPTNGVTTVPSPAVAVTH